MRAARDVALLVVFMAAVGFALQAGVSLWDDADANRLIAAQAAGREAAVDRHAAPDVRAARGLYLLHHDQVDAALAMFDTMPEKPAEPRAVLLYGLANAHLRRAMEVFDSAPIRRVAPLVNLAKTELRQALTIDPGNWDARYNYDLAAALVHDPEPASFQKGEDMARERATVPDAAGAPNGLP